MALATEKKWEPQSNLQKEDSLSISSFINNSPINFHINSTSYSKDQMKAEFSSNEINRPLPTLEFIVSRRFDSSLGTDQVVPINYRTCHTIGSINNIRILQDLWQNNPETK